MMDEEKGAPLPRSADAPADSPDEEWIGSGIDQVDLVGDATCIASCDAKVVDTKMAYTDTKDCCIECNDSCMQWLYDSDFMKSLLGKLRRIWSISPIVLGLFNTVVKVNDIAASLSIIQPDPEWEYGQGIYWMSSKTRLPTYTGAPETTGAVAIENVSSFTYNTCQYSQPVSLKMGCDYSVYTAYTAFLVIWVSYFGILGGYHLLHSIHYSTYDLRFYLSAQLANSTAFNLYYVLLGHVFTLVTVVVGWAFCLINIRNGIPGQESTAAGVGVFGVLNFLALLPFSSVIFAKMDAAKPVRLFYRPNRQFRVSIYKGKAEVTICKDSNCNYGPDFDEVKIEKGSDVWGIGIPEHTVVVSVGEVAEDGKSCTVFLNHEITKTMDTEVSFRLPHKLLKDLGSDVFNGTNADHYELVSPEFESMLDEEMKKKKDSYRKAQMSAGACSACAAFCGCNRLQGEGLLTPIEEDKRVGGDKGKQVLHAGVYGYEKCGIVALRQLRTTAGFINEKLGVDISVIPEDKTIFNGWGAALNVESVFRELQEKVLRMSMIEDYLRDPENKTGVKQPEYNPTANPPLDLFSLREMERQEKLQAKYPHRARRDTVQKPFGLYDSATKMFEVLYMAEVSTERILQSIKKLNEDAAELEKRRKAANADIAVRGQLKRMEEIRKEAAAKKPLLKELSVKNSAAVDKYEGERSRLEAAIAAATAATDESAANKERTRLDKLESAEEARQKRYEKERNKLDLEIKVIESKFRDLKNPKLSEDDIAKEMRTPELDEGDVFSPAEVDEEATGSWLQRLADWAFGPSQAAQQSIPDFSFPSLASCSAPPINCAAAVEPAVVSDDSV